MLPKIDSAQTKICPIDKRFSGLERVARRLKMGLGRVRPLAREVPRYGGGLQCKESEVPALS